MPLHKVSQWELAEALDVVFFFISEMVFGPSGNVDSVLRSLAC